MHLISPFDLLSLSLSSSLSTGRNGDCYIGAPGRLSISTFIKQKGTYAITDPRATIYLQTAS